MINNKNGELTRFNLAIDLIKRIDPIGKIDVLKLLNIELKKDSLKDSIEEFKFLINTYKESPLIFDFTNLKKEKDNLELPIEIKTLITDTKNQRTNKK